MLKRCLTVMLALLIAAALPPGGAPAAAASQGRPYKSYKIDFRSHGEQDGIHLHIDRGTQPRPESAVFAAVPAGTEPALVTPASITSLDEGTYTLTDMTLSRETFMVGFVDAKIGIGDYNFYFFVKTEDDSYIISESKCYRMYPERTLFGYYEILNGLNPPRESLVLPYWNPLAETEFDVLWYNDEHKSEDEKANTYVEILVFGYETGKTRFYLQRYGVEPEWEHARIVEGVGYATYTVTGTTGLFTLHYTVDGGETWRPLGYLAMLNGRIMQYPMSPDKPPPKAVVDIFASDTGRYGDGKIEASIVVKDEDYSTATSIVLANTASETSLQSWESFDFSGFVTENAAPEHKRKTGSQSMESVTYKFSVTPPELGDGVYSVSVARGAEVFECFRLEVFGGEYHTMFAGELSIKPLEADAAYDGDYIRLWLASESLRIPAGQQSFSLNGGDKWDVISKFKDDKLSSYIDKGMELCFADKAPDPASKKPPADAKIIRFPKVAKRDAAPKIAVNYRLAHMKDGKLVFGADDLNMWVPVEKNAPNTAIGAGYVYRFEGVAEKNGQPRPSGKPNTASGFNPLPAEGIAVHESESNETNRGMAYKSVKRSYFVYTEAAYIDGVYRPPSKPAKLSVSSYTKPPKMAVNYKTETIKLTKGIVLDLKELYDGVVSDADAKKQHDISEFMNAGRFGVAYRVPPTDKKPASGIAFYAAAFRADKSELVSAIDDNGKFKPAKDIEFRKKGADKWGSFKAASSAGIHKEYEYRVKNSAKSGKLQYYGGDVWGVDDNWKDDDTQVYAAGPPQDFEYEWATWEDERGKTKSGIVYTNLT
ncbi:MAG: hypothetical protein FWH06_00135 [Oscillospiraceae bacterium]|nr:hypothetical protein [Oscillospiraceae bacterium]